MLPLMIRSDAARVLHNCPTKFSPPIRSPRAVVAVRPVPTYHSRGGQRGSLAVRDTDFFLSQYF